MLNAILVLACKPEPVPPAKVIYSEEGSIVADHGGPWTVFALPGSAPAVVANAILFDPLSASPNTAFGDVLLPGVAIAVSPSGVLAPCDDQLCQLSWDGIQGAAIPWDGWMPPQTMLELPDGPGWLAPHWQDGTAVVANTAAGPVPLVLHDGITWGPFYSQLLVQDFDGDGAEDLLLIHPPAGIIAYFLGPIAPETPWSMASAKADYAVHLDPTPTSAHVADDMLVLSWSDPDGDTYGCAHLLSELETVPCSQDVRVQGAPLTVADFDDDGVVDMVFATKDEASVRFGDGAVVMLDWRDVFNWGWPPDFTSAILDADQDGRPDVAIGTPYSNLRPSGDVGIWLAADLVQAKE